MSAHLAKQPRGLFTPNTLAYGAPAVQQRRGATLFSRLAGAFRWVAEYPSRRAVIAELENLSDRDLADIGLQRNDIARIFRA